MFLSGRMLKINKPTVFNHALPTTLTFRGSRLASKLTNIFALFCFFFSFPYLGPCYHHSVQQAACVLVLSVEYFDLCKGRGLGFLGGLVVSYVGGVLKLTFWAGAKHT